MMVLLCKLSGGAVKDVTKLPSTNGTYQVDSSFLSRSTGFQDLPSATK